MNPTARPAHHTPGHLQLSLYTSNAPISSPHFHTCPFNPAWSKSCLCAVPFRFSFATEDTPSKSLPCFLLLYLLLTFQLSAAVPNCDKWSFHSQMLLEWFPVISKLQIQWPGLADLQPKKSHKEKSKKSATSPHPETLTHTPLPPSVYMDTQVLFHFVGRLFYYLSPAHLLP